MATCTWFSTVAYVCWSLRGKYCSAVQGSWGLKTNAGRNLIDNCKLFAILFKSMLVQGRMGPNQQKPPSLDLPVENVDTVLRLCLILDGIETSRNDPALRRIPPFGMRRLGTNADTNENITPSLLSMISQIRELNDTIYREPEAHHRREYERSCPRSRPRSLAEGRVRHSQYYKYLH